MHSQEFKKQFGKRVQFFRERKGLAQAALAEKIGLKSWEQISKIERGNSGTRIETAVLIAQVLGVSLADLFDMPLFDGRGRRKSDMLKAHLAFLLAQDEAYILYVHEQAVNGVMHWKKKQ